MSKIRLFGCRWYGAAKRISMEILVAELHHRGSKMVYHTPVLPQQRIPVISRKRFSLSWEDRSHQCARYGRLLSLRKALCGMCPSPQAVRSLRSAFHNQTESRPIRRRSLPDTGRLQRRFSFFCGSLSSDADPPPGSHDIQSIVR